METQLEPSKFLIENEIARDYILNLLTKIKNNIGASTGSSLNPPGVFRFQLPAGVSKAEIKQRLRRNRYWIAEKTNGSRFVLLFGIWPDELLVSSAVVSPKSHKKTSVSAQGELISSTNFGFVNPYFAVMIDRKHRIYQMSVQGQERMFRDNVLIDGELVWDFQRAATSTTASAVQEELLPQVATSSQQTFKRKLKFLAFDLLHPCNERDSYQTRHATMSSFLSANGETSGGSGVGNNKHSMETSSTASTIHKQAPCKFMDDSITIKVKPIYAFSDLLWLNKSRSTLSHASDGIIFTPHENGLPILKWKERHTVDLRWKYNFKTKCSFLYWGDFDATSKVFQDCEIEQFILKDHNKVIECSLVHNELLQNILDRIETEEEKLFLETQGIVTEFECFPHNLESLENKHSSLGTIAKNANANVLPIHLETFCLREDKQFPNAKKTIQETVRLVLENITIQDFVQ